MRALAARILIGCAVVIACARPAAAEWQFAPFFGWEFAGHTSFIDLELASDDMHRSFGLTVTHLGRGVLGFEGTALYVPGYFNDPKRPDDPARPGTDDIITSSRVYALMGNAVVAAPLGWNEYGLRPYVSGGFGLIHADESDAPVGAIVVHQRLFGLNVGGGAVGFLTDTTGLRFDLRFYSNVRNVEDVDTSTIPGRKHLRFWVASVGLVFR